MWWKQTPTLLTDSSVCDGSRIQHCSQKAVYYVGNRLQHCSQTVVCVCVCDGNRIQICDKLTHCTVPLARYMHECSITDIHTPTLTHPRTHTYMHIN